MRNKLDTVSEKIDKYRVLLKPVIEGKSDREVKRILCHRLYFQTGRRKTLSFEDREVYDFLLHKNLDPKTIYSHWICLEYPEHIQKQLRDRKIGMKEASSRAFAYNRIDWFVKNLFIIPLFFITSSIIEKRKPLSDKARRHGWTGCNILLDNIPEDGKIGVIRDEKLIEMEIVNKKWKKMFFLNRQKPSLRGWTSDVLKCLEDLPENEFTLNDVYKFKDYLGELHPENKHMGAKIRQQLQILRDNHIISFSSRGKYLLLGK